MGEFKFANDVWAAVVAHGFNTDHFILVDQAKSGSIYDGLVEIVDRDTGFQNQNQQGIHFILVLLVILTMFLQKVAVLWFGRKVT